MNKFFGAAFGVIAQFLSALAVTSVAFHPLLASAQTGGAHGGGPGGAPATGLGMTSMTVACNVYAGGVIETVVRGRLVEDGVSRDREVRDFFLTQEIDWRLIAAATDPAVVDNHLLSRQALAFRDSFTPTGSPLFSQTRDVFAVANANPAPGQIREVLMGMTWSCLSFVADRAAQSGPSLTPKLHAPLVSPERFSPSWDALSSTKQQVKTAERLQSGGSGAMKESINKWTDKLRKFLERKWVRRILRWFDVYTIFEACISALNGGDASAIASCIVQLLLFLLQKNPWGALIGLIIDILLILLDAIGLDPFCAACRQVPGWERWCPSCVDDPESETRSLGGGSGTASM